MKLLWLYWSDLVLYAKGWLRFKDSLGFEDDMIRLSKRICGVPCSDYFYFVILACYQIKNFCKNHKIDFGDKLDSMLWLYTEAQKYQSIENIPQDQVIIKICLSELLEMPLNNIRINSIDYEKDNLYIQYHENLSFKESQELFNKQFSNNLDN